MSDFKTIYRKNVTLLYPKVDQPYAFDSYQGKSLPADPLDQQAAFSISWVETPTDAAPFLAELEAHFKATAPDKTFDRVFGLNQDEDGNYVFTAKRNASRKGQLKQAPKVIDGHGNELQDKRFYSGSIGSVKVSAHPAPDPQKRWGIRLDLAAVQVIEPVYGDTDEGFDYIAEEEPNF